jgi:uncharacterized protein (TIGR03545 family)
MIRWSYLIPRLILLTAAVLLVRRWLDPLLCWTVVRVGERVAMAKVDVGQVTTHLPTAEFCLRDVQVANTHNPARNLFEADQISLGFETNALLKRKFVVREGRISGLRIGTARATPGTLDKRGGLLDWLPDDLGVHLDPGQLVDFGRTWLERFAIVLKHQIAEEVEQFESVRLARELTTRWPAELARMEARVDQFKARANRLQQLAKGGSADPLENLGKAQQIVSEIESLERDIAIFRGEIERLRDQSLRDRDNIVAAQRNDLRQIRERLRLDDLESGGLSEYLLGHELNQRVQTAAHWIRWLREHVPARGADEPADGPKRARGVDVMFAGVSPRPDFLIRSLNVEGEGQARGERFEFLGTVQGLTTQPRVYGQPAVFHIEVRGPVAMQVEAILDRTQPIARDHITVECPALAQPKRLLGKPDQIAVAVSPANARLSLSLQLEGENLSGRLTVRQEPVELKPELAAAYGGPQMAARIHDALREIRVLDVTAQLSGTLQRPTCQIRSTLGPQLAQAFQGLLVRELENRREELSQMVQAKVEGEMLRFEQSFLARQQELLARLQQNGVDVQQVRELATRQVPGLDRVLDKNLPKELQGKLPKDLRLRF